jgi:hypothetical protein
MADTRLSSYDWDYLMCRGFLRHAYAFAEDDREVRPDYPPSRTTVRYAKVCENCGLYIVTAVNKITGERLFTSSKYPEHYIIQKDDEHDYKVTGFDVRQECARRLNGASPKATKKKGG